MASRSHRDFFQVIQIILETIPPVGHNIKYQRCRLIGFNPLLNLDPFTGTKARLELDRLEDRVLLSAVLVNNILTVTGGAGNDNISITPNGAPDEVTVTGDPDNPSPKNFNSVESIIVNTLGGKDTITIDLGVTLPTTLDGGDGPDTLLGGSGNDTFVSSKGKDSYDGRAGTDTFDAGLADSAIHVDLAKELIKRDGFDGRSETLKGVENVIGSNFNDRIAGDDTDNSLNGGGGNDRIDGREGDNTITGGNVSQQAKINLKTGIGDDSFDITTGDFAKLLIRSKAGDNTITGGNVSQQAKINLKTGIGDDSFDITTGDFAKLLIRSKAGDNNFDVNVDQAGKINLRAGAGDSDTTLTTGTETKSNVKFGSGTHTWNLDLAPGSSIVFANEGNNTGSVKGGTNGKFKLKNGNDKINGDDLTDYTFNLRTPDLRENKLSPNQLAEVANSWPPRLNLKINFVPGCL